MQQFCALLLKNHLYLLDWEALSQTTIEGAAWIEKCVWKITHNPLMDWAANEPDINILQVCVEASWAVRARISLDLSSFFDNMGKLFKLTEILALTEQLKFKFERKWLSKALLSAVSFWIEISWNYININMHHQCVPLQAEFSLPAFLLDCARRLQ